MMENSSPMLCEDYGEEKLGGKKKSTCALGEILMKTLRRTGKGRNLEEEWKKKYKDEVEVKSH